MSGGRGLTREATRWLVSGALVLAAHGGAAAVLVGWAESMPAGAPSQVVMLDLGAAGAPPAPKSDSPPAPNDADYSPSPDPVDKIEKEELKPPEKMVELKQEPDPPKEVVKRQPDPEPPPPEPPKMKPAEVVLPKPTPPKQAKPVQKKQQMASLQSRRTSQDEVAERPAAVSAGASGAARATYAQQLVAHLQRYKRYPDAGRAVSAQGITLVTFTIDRSGRLLASHVMRGSGFSELDRESMDVVKRAQPFPAPPPEVTGQLQYTAPLRYDPPPK